ncbi:MAG: hypothetical protein ACFFAM_16665 [Promethearchaeota archaeon]
MNFTYIIEDIKIIEEFEDLDLPHSSPRIKTNLTPVIDSPQIDFGLDSDSEDLNLLYLQSLFLKTTVHFLLEESIIYRRKGMLSLSFHYLLDLHKMKKDPEVKNQIRSIIIQLEATKHNLYSKGG